MTHHPSSTRRPQRGRHPRLPALPGPVGLLVGGPRGLLARLLVLALVVLGLVVQTSHAPRSFADQATSSDGRVRLTVTPSTTSLPAGGGTVTYTYTVTNTGSDNLWAHTAVTVTDPSCTTITWVSGERQPIYPGASVVYRCTRTVTATTTSTASTNHYYYPNAWSTTTANTSVSASATVTVGTQSGPAPTQTPMVCTTPTVWVAQNPAGTNATQLYVQYTTATSSQFIAVGTNTQWGYNALAYNPRDGYLYAVSNWSATGGFADAGHLLRIDGTGTIRDLGALTINDTINRPSTSVIASELGTSSASVPGGQNAGTIDPATGTYYVANMSTSGAGVFYSIALGATPSLTMTAISAAQSTNLTNDFTFVGGALYGVRNTTNTLVRYTLATKTWSTVATVAGLPTDTYGAVWTYGNGTIGMDGNSGGAGHLAQVSTSGTLLNSTTGLATSNNDGANCTGTQGADLAIDKSGTANVAPGGQVTFALTVTNQGPGVSSGGYVTDTVPPAYTNVAVEAAYQKMCTVSGNAIRCQTGILNPGDSYTITVTATAPASGTAATLRNTATVTGNETDPDPGDNTDDHTPSVTNAVIDLAKTAAAPTATPGANGTYTATYTVTVRNTGTTAGTYGPVTDLPTLPTGATASSATWSGGPAGAAATAMSPDANGTYTFGPTTSLAAGATDRYTVAITYTLAAGTSPASLTTCAAGGGVRNLASTAGESASAPTANNTACVDPAPAFDVAKAPGTVTGPAADGTYTARYTVTVRNLGPVAGSYPQVTDSPALGAAATVTGLTWSRNGGAATTLTGPGPFALGAASTPLAVGATDTYAVSVRFTVADGHGSTLAACGTTPAPGTGLYNAVSMPGDADPSNNAACDGTVDVAKAPGTVTGPDAQGGYAATYTVTVRNTGVATTYGDLVDTPAFPAAATVTGATVSRNGGAAQALTGAGPFTLAAAGTAIAAGATDTYAVTVRYTVADGGAGTLGSCAAGAGLRNTVALPDEIDPTNDAACDEPLAFAVSKSLAAGQAPQVALTGTTWSAAYTITVTNRGTTTATSPQVTDLPSVPAGFTTGSVTVDGAPVTGTPYVVTPGVRLAAGASRSYTVVVSGALAPAAVDTAAGVCDTTGAGNPRAGLFNAVAMAGDADGTANNDACVSYTLTRTLHVAKVDPAGTPLAGASFDLYDTDPQGAVATPVAKGLTADAGGTTFTSAPLVAGRTYWVVERTAPTGHELLPSPARVEVTTTGVRLVGETPGVRAAGTDAFGLVVTDPQHPTLPATGGRGAGAPMGGLAVVLAALAIAARRRTLA